MQVCIFVVCSSIVFASHVGNNAIGRRKVGRQRPKESVAGVGEERGMNADEDLRRLLHVSRCSKKSIEKILNLFPVKTKNAKRRIRAANAAPMQGMEVATPVDIIDGPQSTLYFADAAVVLEQYVRRSRVMQEALTAALAKHGAPTIENPWAMTIGLDEFTPGNQFRPDNARKTMVVSFTFHELGPLAIQCDDCWLTTFVVPSRWFKTVVGGWPRCFNAFLRHLEDGPTNMATIGAILVVAGRTFVLYSRVRRILTDNDGFRMTFGLKGASGLRPCLRCWNCWMKGAAPAGQEDITCHKLSRFESTAQGDLDDVIDALTVAKVRATSQTGSHDSVAACEPRA